MRFDERGDHHRDRAVWRSFADLQHEFEQWRDDAAVRRRGLHQARRLQPGSPSRALDLVLPAPPQPLGILFPIGAFEPRQMHRDDLRREAQRIAHGSFGEPVPLADRDDDDRRGQIVERDGTLVNELPIDLCVVALCQLEERQDKRDRQHRNPGALDKFCAEDHGKAGAGGESTGCIDPEPHAMAEPSAAFIFAGELA